MTDQQNHPASSPALTAHPLNDGHQLPAVGFGTLVRGAKDEPGGYVMATRSALSGGYRLLDSALRYNNERDVGQAVRASDIPREEIIVTTKIPGRFHGYRGAKESVRVSLQNMEMDRVEMVLIHWPLPRLDQYVETWKAMIEMREDGLIGSIGVSNFTASQLRRLQAETGVVPAVNQVEMHPYFNQSQLRQVHEQLGVVTQAWSPLGRGTEVMEEKTLSRIAEERNVTPGQVVLRWHVQHGSVPLPASSNLQRQRDNLNLDFELSADDMAAVDALDRGRIWDQDPELHEEY